MGNNGNAYTDHYLICNASNDPNLLYNHTNHVFRREIDFVKCYCLFLGDQNFDGVGIGLDNDDLILSFSKKF